MLISSLRHALRLLRLRWRTSALSIGGLALGIGVAVLAGLFVLSQWSVGWAHEDAESIYRVHEPGEAYTYDDELFYIQDAYGDAVSVAAFVKEEGVVLNRSAGASGGSRRSEALFYTTPEVFEVFSYPLAQGDAGTALQNPSSIVLSQEAAADHFPDGHALGQTLRIPGDTEPLDLTVTGVMKPLPSNMHVRPDYLVPMANMAEEDGDIIKWINVYVKTQRSPSIDQVVASTETWRRAEEVRRSDDALTYTPLTDIYLYSDVDEEIAPTGSLVYVTAFGVVGILILIIACINYVSITTAQMGERLRSVGLLKTFGANRMQVAGHFVMEAFATTMTAVLAGLVFAATAVPIFNQLAPDPIDLSRLATPSGVGLIFGVMVFTMVLSSAYPALYLSGLHPTDLFQKRGGVGGRARVRKALVVTQLALALGLTAVTVVIVQQSLFLAEKDLGLDREHTLMVNTRYAGTAGESGVLSTEERSRRLDVIETQLAARSDVRATGRMAYRPNSDWVFFRSVTLPAPDSSAEPTEVRARVLYSTPGITDALGLKMVEGQGFKQAPEGIIVNRKAASILGPRATAGAAVDLRRMRNDTTTVIAGIVEDFHFESLRSEIRPVVFLNADFWRADEYLMVRSEPGASRPVREAVEAAWTDVMPPATFAAQYMDQEFEQMHRADHQQRNLLLILAGLTLLVSCLGLTGLVSYLADRRKGEIGVRKTLGATVSSIVMLFTHEVVRGLGVATLIGLPLAYLIATEWLAQFAYRISPGIVVGIVSITVVGAVAMGATALQAYRAATADVVASLRDE